MEWSWPASVGQALGEAGWFPGRCVDVTQRQDIFADTLPMHETAERFLSEFGGLAVHVQDPGAMRARKLFDLDPELARGEDDRFEHWGEKLGQALFPIGGVDCDRFFPGIDEHGGIYLVEGWIASFGPMPKALENLVAEVRPIRIA